QKTRVILVGVDALPSCSDQPDLDRMAQCQNAQLLELLGVFKWVRRLGRQLQQELAPVCVDTQVLQKSGRLAAEIRLAVTHVRNRATAEIERPPARIANYLYAIGIGPLLHGGNRSCQSRHIGFRIALQKRRQLIERCRLDQRLISLQVDEDVAI